MIKYETIFHNLSVPTLKTVNSKNNSNIIYQFNSSTFHCSHTTNPRTLLSSHSCKIYNSLSCASRTSRRLFEFTHFFGKHLLLVHQQLIGLYPLNEFICFGFDAGHSWNVFEWRDSVIQYLEDLARLPFWGMPTF